MPFYESDIILSETYIKKVTFSKVIDSLYIFVVLKIQNLTITIFIIFYTPKTITVSAGSFHTIMH